MTTEDRLDDQGLKTAEEEEVTLSPEDQEISDLEGKIEQVSRDDEDSEEASSVSEQPTGESDQGTAIDEKDEDVPEGLSESAKQAFIKQRLEIKELKKKLNSKVDDPPPSQEDESPAETAPAEQAGEQATAEQVFDLYIRALNKDLTDEELSKAGSESQVVRLAETALAKHLSSAQIYDAMQKAIDSDSPLKEDILEIGNKYLSLARFREESAEKQREQGRTEAMKAYESELAQVKESYPDFLEEESSIAKFGKEWDRRMIGSMDERGNRTQGELDEQLATYLLSHPMQHAKMILDAFNLSAKSGEHAKEAIKKLTKERSVLDSGESGSPPLSGEKVIRTADDIEAQLEALSVGLI